MRLTKRTLRFGNRIREDTVFVCKRRFVRDDHEYSRGDIVPKDIPELKRLWNIDKVHMYFFELDEPVEMVLDEIVTNPTELPTVDEQDEDSTDPPEDEQDEDPPHDPDADVPDENVGHPEPVSHGSGWYEIDGVEGKFRGREAAIEAWEQAHGF